MAIEIYPIGGYYEVGKNMTAVKVDDEVVIFDMGLHIPNYIKYTEEEREDVMYYEADELRTAHAIPDDRKIAFLKDKVKAIIPTHAHLDHIGAIPYIAKNYPKAPVLATPYSCMVLRTILKDEKIRIPNQIKQLSPNATFKLSEKLTIEFINMTHSVPQTVMVALHTPYGVVLYANDFKFDNHPIVGKKPNYNALKRIGKKGVKVAIIDSLYADTSIKTPSEKVAREMLRDVMLGVDSKGKAVIVTTFSSHIARLKSIVEFGRMMGRKVVFMGRSLRKYINAAEDANLIKFSDKGEIVGFGRKIKSRLKAIQKEGIENYLLVVTGHQGEPKATLSKMANKVFPFKFHTEDEVIFSCAVIPSEINKIQRAHLESVLRQRGTRIFKDIHVSGHAAREDLRDFINLIKAEHIIPAHADKARTEAMIDLCTEMKYKVNKTAHPLKNKKKLVLN